MAANNGVRSPDRAGYHRTVKTKFRISDCIYIVCFREHGVVRGIWFTGYNLIWPQGVRSTVVDVGYCSDESVGELVRCTICPTDGKREQGAQSVHPERICIDTGSQAAEDLVTAVVALPPRRAPQAR